jgi:copper(I)-binding protein
VKFLIRFISIFTVVLQPFYLQPALASDSVAKNSTSAKKESAKKESLDIRVTNAFIYAPLGASKTTTGFFTIDNRSASDITITGISSNFAKQIKLMPKSALVVPAHESLTLKPKGAFLQINDLKSRLSTGDELHLSISLSNGQKLHIIAVVKSAYDQTHGH